MDDTTWMIHGLPVLGGLLGLLCLWAGGRKGFKRRLVDHIPTSKTTGVFIGLVEVQGTAEAERPLVSHLAGRQCVHYGWSVEERWSRTVTETYTDSKGKRRTRTRRESGWRNVAQGGSMIPFYLKDDLGVILVRPEGADIQHDGLFQHTCGRSDPLYYGKGPALAVANSDHRRRFREWGVPLHAPLYVIGQAREREDVVAPEIAADSRAPMFVISTRSRDQVSRGFALWQWGFKFIGLALVVGGVFGWQHATDSTGNPTPPVAAGAVYLAAAVIGWIWMAYNSLVDLRNRVRQAWAQVDVQLKRRHDLIPRLASVVEGLRGHEQDTQRALAEMRGQMRATGPGEPGEDHHGVGATLIALEEKHPELVANDAFMQLEKNLLDTENRIALARGYFNEIATHYNTRLEVIPDKFVARLGRMKPRPLMAAAEFERKEVRVNLAD